MNLRGAALVVSACALVTCGCTLAHETCSAAPCEAGTRDASTRDAGPPPHDAATVPDAARADTWPTTPVDAARPEIDAAPDAGADTGPSDVVPRPIAPLSTATVTTRYPTLRWSLPRGVDGARVEICADRDCTTLIESADVMGSHYQTAMELPATVVFWRLFGRTGEGVGDVPSPTWELVVPSRSAPLDASFGTTLDFDGDGYADVVVGAPHAQEAHVYPGGALGSSATPATTLTGTSPSGFPTGFGGAVASAGDVNGDGLGDVIIGARYSNSAVVYLGSRTGLSDATATILHVHTMDGNFGSSVASAGDVNADGYADVIVGGDALAAYVYFGRPGGLATTPSQTLVGAARAVAGVGDVNGDGFADALVSSAMSDVAGDVRLYLGSASGLGRSFTLDPGDFRYRGFGTGVAGIGDVNGDGLADFAVSAPQGPGHVIVYEGRTTGFLTTATTTLAASGYTELGSWLSGGGDVNGDGYSDLAASTFGIGSEPPGAFVYLGGPTGLGGTPPITIALAPPHVGGPGPVVVAGDIDGDGRSELLMTAQLSIGSSVVDVLAGTSTGLSLVPSVVLASPDGAGTWYGSSIAMHEAWAFQRRWARA